jgi:hypothetical protein
LIQILNGGVRPEIEEEHTWFIFDVNLPETTENHKIVPHDELYEKSVGIVGHGYVIQMVK